MIVDICDCCEAEVRRRPSPHTCAKCKPIELRFNKMVDEETARLISGHLENKREWMRKNGAPISKAAPSGAEAAPALSPAASPSASQAPPEGASS